MTRDADVSEINALVAPFVERTGGLLTALRAVQSALGCIPEECDAAIAEAFNVSRAEVRGVVSFYSEFDRLPKGTTKVRLCAAEACQAAGGRALCSEIESRLGLRLGQTDPSGALSLERVFCLGLCSVAPAAMVGDVLIGRADVNRIEAAVSRVQKSAAP